MIDEKKIEEAAQAICFDDKMSYDSYCKIEGFRKGAELFILSILTAKGILCIVRLKPSDFDNLPKFLQDKARKLSNVVENLMN